MNLKPINDRILCRCDKPEEETKGGIIIPQIKQKRPMEAIVVAVGPGRMIEGSKAGERHPMIVKVGDRIMLPQWGDVRKIDIPDEEGDFWILVEGDALGVLG